VIDAAGTCSHDVLIVVEQAQQLTGSGCCGKLEGDRAFYRGEPVFAATRREQEAAGPLFRLFAELGPAWRVELVDPRNLLSLWPLLLRHLRRHRPPLRQAMRTLLLGFSAPALLLDGRVLTTGSLPSREWLEAVIERLTERPFELSGPPDTTSAGEGC
jgi:hypothetical protein